MDMAVIKSSDSKVSPEGRVVVPAAIRQILGVGPGDYVRFVVEEGQVRLVTPRMLAMALWANNHGGDAGDSADDVRAARAMDQEVAAAQQERIDEDVAAARDSRSDDELAATLLAAANIGA
jgi:antitoxin PrlF